MHQFAHREVSIKPYGKRDLFIYVQLWLSIVTSQETLFAKCESVANKHWNFLSGSWQKMLMHLMIEYLIAMSIFTLFSWR